MNVSKKELVDHCRELLIAKESTLKTELKIIREAASNETKSSMGDKYETGKEMLQQEENKLISQLKLISDQLVTLVRIDHEKVSEKVELGALLSTDDSNYFISISFGKVEFNGEVIFLISSLAPLAKLFAGKRQGEEITFNGINHRIQTIA